MPNPEFGDCVGVESSADLDSDAIGSAPHVGAITRRCRRLAAARKEFPPPISWLENLPSHMPWVMRKYHTSDGRLVIKEERVKRHDYFLADRSDGRLVLNLIHVDDVVEESSKECGDAAEGSRSPEIGGGDEGQSELTVEEVVAAECYKYKSVGLMPCGGFVATAPVFRPPVHT